MPTKSQKPFTGNRRKLKAKKVKIPTEAIQRVLASVVKGADHWTLDPDDWGLPSADNGSRRIVFEATHGPVSSSSIVYASCSGRGCVKPSHCLVENAKDYELRLQGKLPRYVFSVGRNVVTQEAFERGLRDCPSNEPKAAAARKRALIARRALAKEKKEGTQELTLVEDPQGGLRFDPVGA